MIRKMYNKEVLMRIKGKSNAITSLFHDKKALSLQFLGMI